MGAFHFKQLPYLSCIFVYKVIDQFKLIEMKDRTLKDLINDSKPIIKRGAIAYSQAVIALCVGGFIAFERTKLESDLLWYVFYVLGIFFLYVSISKHIQWVLIMFELLKVEIEKG